jgi:hypothetical protein
MGAWGPPQNSAQMSLPEPNRIPGESWQGSFWIGLQNTKNNVGMDSSWWHKGKRPTFPSGTGGRLALNFYCNESLMRSWIINNVNITSDSNSVWTACKTIAIAIGLLLESPLAYSSCFFKNTNRPGQFITTSLKLAMFYRHVYSSDHKRELCSLWMRYMTLQIKTEKEPVF